MAVKHKARGFDPRIRALADELGIIIFRRDGELWGNGDVQLTYKYIGGKSQARPLNEQERIELAIDLLTGIKDARAKWGSPADRAAKVLTGMESVEYQPRTYASYRDESLDEGTMVNTWISPRWEMWLRLVGKDEVHVTGETRLVCMSNLVVKCTKRWPDVPTALSRLKGGVK